MFKNTKIIQKLIFKIKNLELGNQIFKGTVFGIGIGIGSNLSNRTVNSFLIKTNYQKSNK